MWVLFPPDHSPVGFSHSLALLSRSRYVHICSYLLKGTSEPLNGDLDGKLEQLLGLYSEDPARVDLLEQWRPYMWLRDGSAPEGPPISKMNKLQASLAQFLPDAELSGVEAMLEAIEASIRDRWKLPPS
jgi:hypothetical protein